MAKYGPVSAFILVGGKNLTGDTFGLVDRIETVAEETHALGDSWEEHIPVGLSRVVLEAPGGIYDDGDVGMIAAFRGQGATLQLVSYGVEGNTIGQDAVLLNGTYAMSFERIAARDGLTKADARHTITGEYLRGVILHEIAAETAASGDTESAESVDNSASSADGATADLHVPALALGGYTDVTVKVRHSTDDISFSDLIVFTNVSTAGSAERKTVAGTINRYLAMSWLFNGAGSSQSVTPYVALNRG